MKNTAHSFHIPVMGTGFTIDTPVKVAHYGISSVISIIDDMLIERMRKYYCEKENMEYREISLRDKDHRAKRVTSYLNLINQLVLRNFKQLKQGQFDESGEIEKYFELLPDSSPLKTEYIKMKQTDDPDKKKAIQEHLRNNLVMGSVDVNIMTKLDKVNYHNNTDPLPTEYNDAHAALKGYAQSDLNSGIILSAGMNPRLYAYMENFQEFYLNKKGGSKKKIILKVSDYRSALIQGKFLAKKGLWVSEYRVESGLNCGGHAFASHGYLFGPILEEFKNRTEELAQQTYDICKPILNEKGIDCPENAPAIIISAQGGIGESTEQEFLLNHYNIVSVGWGTPFLLVPEVTNVDKKTLKILAGAKEEDLYLSHISPLGIPFNTVKGNTKDLEKNEFIRNQKPGSPCPKKYLSLNTEFTDTAICVSSKKYQDLKINELKGRQLSPKDYKKSYDSIVEKSCLCVGLAASSLISNNINKRSDGEGVSICPGPNLAYFDQVVSLKEMVNHIYGRVCVNVQKGRPNFFVKELSMYLDYLRHELENSIGELTEKNLKYFETFKQNLLNGIEYYKNLFTEMKEESQQVRKNIIRQLQVFEDEIKKVQIRPA